MIEGELLRDRAPLRVTEDGCALDAELREELCQIGCDLRDVIGRRQAPAVPVTAQVGHDHAMARGEPVEHRFVHGPAHH